VNAVLHAEIDDLINTGTEVLRSHLETWKEATARIRRIQGGFCRRISGPYPCGKRPGFSTAVVGRRGMPSPAIAALFADRPNEQSELTSSFRLAVFLLKLTA